jgi:FkbM family methyltransferase
LVAAQAVGPEGHVYAFEPVPELFSALKRNVELNGFRNVTCVRAAVTDRSGEVAIEDTSSLPSKAGATLLARSPDMPMINVPAVTIDGFSCEHELTKVDFVKMDIEGSEVLALRGMSKLLSGPQGPDVLCEVTDSLLKRMGSGGEELCRFLINLGYAPYKPVYHRLERTSTNGERITLPSNLGENYFFSKDHNLK